MRFLEEFWYGNIAPAEYDTTGNKDYANTLYKLVQNEEMIMKAMDSEQKNLFEQYTESVRRFQSVEMCLVFQRGFKLGARMIAEVMEG